MSKNAKSSTQNSVFIACGGTGGHFMPGIVTGGALEKVNFQPYYFGEGKKIEEILIKDHGVSLIRPITGGGRLKRGLSLFSKILKEHFIHKPKLCILCGGFSSFILGLYGILFRVPLVILEQNTLPGRVNRILSYFSKFACVTFKSSEYFLNCKSFHTGNPVRNLDKEQAKEIDLLIMGGSQGARAINLQLPKLINGKKNIVHVCGPGNREVSESNWKETNHQVTVFEHHSEMLSLISKSKWVVTRAGATSLSECAALGASCVAVPYPFAKDQHQLKNAKELEEKNALMILEEKKIDQLKDLLNKTLDDDIKAQQFSKNIKLSGIGDVLAEKTVATIKGELNL